MDIEYNEIEHIAKLLFDDKIILYPTDTVWGFGCLVNNEQGIARINQIKNRTADKSRVLFPLSWSPSARDREVAQRNTMSDSELVFR